MFKALCLSISGYSFHLLLPPYSYCTCARGRFHHLLFHSHCTCARGRLYLLLFDFNPFFSTHHDTRATSEVDSSILRSQSSNSDSESSEIFPFEIWYHDNIEDALPNDPYFWVDPNVKKVSSALIRPNSLLGMAKAICQCEPWSVTVFPYRPDEPVNGRPEAGEAPFFYIYNTLPLKLGVKLPFTHFERSILRALNVAPTQLHLNSWTFVRVFELLCEDMGRAPSLSIFFWFFSLRKTTKVGWTSLSNRPKRKLLKPFLESFKVFKNCYFKSVVFVSVARKDLEKWEDEFIEELNDVPLLSSADLIKGAGYSTGYLRNIKKKTSLIVPLAAVEPGDAPQAIAEEAPQVQPMVILDSLEGSPFSTEADQTLGGKRTAGDDSDIDDFVLGAPDDHPATKTEGNAIIEEVLIGRPSSPLVWARSLAVGQVVDRHLAAPSDCLRVKNMDITGTFSTLQRFAGCSLILARVAEAEFGFLEK
ncbi:hypothetical protein CR513_39794, partial [Mucuna pruriens]